MTILRTTAQITEILDQLARRIKGAYAEPPRLIGLHTGGPGLRISSPHA